MERESAFDKALRDLLPPEVEASLKKYGVLKRQTLEVLKTRGYSFPGTADLPGDLEKALLELCELKGIWAKKKIT